MGISAHCGREVSLVNYFILCVVRLGVTPVNYFGKINLADALQSLIQEGIWNSFSEFRNGISIGPLLEGYYCTLIIGDIEDRFTNSSSVDFHQKSHPILSIKSVS